MLHRFFVNQGYVPGAVLQCPAANNALLPHQTNYLTDWTSSIAVWTKKGSDVGLPDPWKTNLGPYCAYSSSPEWQFFNTLLMKRPGDTLIFADAVMGGTGDPNRRPRPRFWNTSPDTGSVGVYELHDGQSGIGYADGHAALKNGLDLNESIANIRCWVTKEGTFLSLSS